MKMSRSDLKQLVKECLIELLAEGLSSPGEKLTEQFEQPKRQSSAPRRPKFDPRLDRPVLEAARQAAGSDGTMAQILADTARTTYTKMGHTLMTAEGAMEAAGMPSSMPVHGLDAVSQIAAEHDPLELFGDDAVNNWAALAFAGGKSPSTSRS